MRGNLVDRPTLAGWLNEYDSIYREFMAAIASGGVSVSRGDSDASATLRGSLREKGALFRNGGASVSYGFLSSACVACSGSRCSKTIAISLKCHRSCYFCLNANQVDYDKYRSRRYDWRSELAEAKRDGLELTHVGLTGGEPLLFPEDVLDFLSETRRMYPGAHTRLYTAGDHLSEELLSRLREGGLREIRVSVKPDEPDAARRTLELISLAVDFIPDVMVEMPVIPGTLSEMKGLLSALDSMGVKGINLLEFCYSLRNIEEFERRGFGVKAVPFDVLYDYSYAGPLPVAGSEEECLRLLEYAIDEGLSLGVHYCSLDNKHRSQIRQMNEGVDVPPYYQLDGEDFFLKAAKVFDGDVAVVRGILDGAGVGEYAVDPDEEALLFGLQHLGLLSGADVVPVVSYSVIERKGGDEMIRELKLAAVGGKSEETSRKSLAGMGVRASMCELLAFSLRYPTPELGDVVASGEWADAAGEIAEALGLELPESFFADARANVSEDPEFLLHALRAEATRLFVGAPEPACSPYEGVWRAADDGVQALLFVNPHSMAVERFCRSCGLGQPQGTNEPLDHAATELELLQYLASLEAGIVEPAPESPASSDLPGGSPAAAYEQFMVDHVLTWMPRFADAVAAETRLPFFRAAARLLAAFLR